MYYYHCHRFRQHLFPMTEISYREMKIYQFENTEINLFGFEGFFPSFSLGQNYMNLQFWG